MISRRSFLVLGLGGVAAAPARGALGAGQRVVIEDWSGPVLGARGVPPGWEPYETPGGHAAYDLAVVEDEGRSALRLRSAGDHSTIAKRVQIDLEAMPILEWSWKLSKMPTGADVRRRETSDLAADVLVIWPRFPALVRSRLIGYAWDAAAPLLSVVRSPKTSTISFVIVQSGSANIGRWMSERRNVAEDYRRIYGDKPEPPGAIALSIDSNDTHSSAESAVGAIAFASS
jgi:Protein of unknown function (DUF3047)